VVLLSSWTCRPTGTTGVPALRLANPEMRPRYLLIIYYSSVYFTIIIWQYFTPRSSIVWGARLRHSYIFVIYCENILHSTCAPIYPRTPQQYVRSGDAETWLRKWRRQSEEKRWIVDKLFGRREINTLIFKNKLYRRIKVHTALVRGQTDTKIYFIYTYI